MAVRVLTPFSCIQHKRFAKQDGWLLRDVALGNSGSIVVSGSNVNSQRTLIVIYAIRKDFDFRDIPSILFLKEFEKYSTKERDYVARKVFFIDPDGIDVVTCLGDELQVIKVSQDKILLSRQVNGETYCLYVKERELFVGFWESNSITVYSTIDLTEIKSIILEGIQDGDWPHDITVNAGKLFACVGHADARSNQTSQIFGEEDGQLLSNLTHPTGTQWYARSIAVNLPTGIIAVVWNNSFYRVEGERWQVVFYHLMSETNSSFLIFDVECGVTRIRISNSGDKTVTGNLLTGEVKIYDTAELFTYGHLKEGLASQLQRDDCLRLANFFGLSEDYTDAFVKSDLPTENIFLALEEKDIIHQSNVERLTEAFLELKASSSCYMLAETYQKTRKQATIYSRFLATLSTHLTTSLPRDLCVYFNISDEKKRSIISNHNPGLSLLLTLDEMGIITPFGVGALEKPLHGLKLVQAVARIKEYQSIFEERMAQLHIKKTELTEEDKKKIFLQCLRKTIKRWYETMTPVPWKKSCRWKLADLFIDRSVILTDSKDKRSLRDIDEKCSIACNKIFSHKRIKSDKRIILEGDPGSGKTMLMSQLAYDWSLGKFNEIEMLILLPLKLLQQKSVGQAIKEFYLLGESRLSIADVESILRCKENNCHLLLDGLEEYSGKIIKGEQSEVMKIMTKAKYPHCKVVITSRSDYIQNLPKYPMLKLRRFGEMERNLYIERVFSDSLVKQMEVKAFIANSSFMLDLCSTPLLFVMAVHNIGRMQNLDESQLDRISPFMREMIETLCSSSHPIDQTETQPGMKPSNEYQSEDHILLHKNAQLVEETEDRGHAPTDYGALNQLNDDHTDQSAQDLTPKEVSQYGVDAQTSKGTRAAVEEYNKNELTELPRDTTQSKEITWSNVKRQSKSEVLVENKVWSEQKDPFENSQKTELKIKKGMSLSLEELAFNGLCRGIQQLSWQKDFVERNVLESKKWVTCGVLVTEERLLSLSERNTHDFARKQHTEPDAHAESLKDETRGGSMLHSKDTQSEQTESSSKGKVPKTSVKFQAEIEKSENNDIETRSNQIMTQVSLQVKFLHKLIQEWFAAKKLSSLIRKSMSLNIVEDFMDEYLRYISPTDLHYVLRFTCFLWPPSLYFIVKYLLHNCHSGMSNAHDYILNCIFLCFAEYNGDETIDTLEAIADICNETITIRGEDSSFLQQAKVALLERASNNWIPIKKLILADVVESASEDILTFNSGVIITVLDTLEILDVSRWDQTLRNDCSCILKFISNCCSAKEARLNLPHPPPHLDETTLASLRKEDTIVTWILGLKMTQTLDSRTGEWMVKSNAEGAKSMNLVQMDDIGYKGSENVTVLSVEGKISMDGGSLRIPGTDVSLWVPPGALEDGKQHCLIQMRVVPPESFNKLSRVFSSNSSVTVELRPNHLRFKRPIKLTLPHCLQLKKGVEYKARIFMSHHEGDITPNWIEQTNLHCELEDRTCTISLNSFCWVKVEIDNAIVEAKKIKVFTAAKPIFVPDDIAEIEVGYHLDLPGAGEILRLNPSFIVGQMRPYLFVKEGNHPLKVSLEKVVSRTWSYTTPEDNPKEISFDDVALSIEFSRPFLLEQDKKRCDVPTCIFKASQNGRDIELNVRPKKVSQDVKNRSSAVMSSGNSEYLQESSLEEEFSKLLAKMAVKLNRDSCLLLATYFNFPDSKFDLLQQGSGTPGIALLRVLKESNIITLYNVARLQKALEELGLQAINQNLVIPYQSQIDSGTYGNG